MRRRRRTVATQGEVAEPLLVVVTGAPEVEEVNPRYKK